MSWKDSIKKDIVKSNEIKEAAKKLVTTASMLDDIELSAKGLGSKTQGQLDKRIEDFKRDFSALLKVVADDHRKHAKIAQKHPMAESSGNYMMGVADEIDALANKIR